MTGKRPRGRPVGSGHDDSGWLMQMDRLLAADPRLTIKAAARRCLGAADVSGVRRLQQKWSEDRKR